MYCPGLPGLLPGMGCGCAGLMLLACVGQRKGQKRLTHDEPPDFSVPDDSAATSPFDTSKARSST